MLISSSSYSNEVSAEENSKKIALSEFEKSLNGKPREVGKFLCDKIPRKYIVKLIGSEKESLLFWKDFKKVKSKTLLSEHFQKIEDLKGKTKNLNCLRFII